MSTALVDYQALLAEEIANLNKTITQPSVPKIRTAGKIFTLPDGRTTPGPFEGIVVDTANENIFYQNAYNPREREKPTCFAYSKPASIASVEDSPFAHDDLIPQAENPQAESCGICKHNEWGSRGKGKACANKITLAILPPDYENEDEIALLTLSPTALSTWSNFVKRVNAEHKMPPLIAKARFSFDPNSAQPIVRVTYAGPHNRDLGEILALRAHAQSLLTAYAS